jgi:hypothetical protein
MGILLHGKRSPYITSRLTNPGVGVQLKYYVNDVAGSPVGLTTDANMKQIKSKGPGMYRIVEVEYSDVSF